MWLPSDENRKIQHFHPESIHTQYLCYDDANEYLKYILPRFCDISYESVQELSVPQRESESQFFNLPLPLLSKPRISW